MPNTVSIKVKNKRDTLANWTKNNPILLDGELAIVIDNDDIKLKVGNGIDTFIALPYIKSDSQNNEENTLTITDDTNNKQYSVSLHVVNGKPVLIYDEIGE